MMNLQYLQSFQNGNVQIQTSIGELGELRELSDIRSNDLQHEDISTL
jgi:hypothetical protein